MKFLRRLDYMLHRRKRDAELAEELEFNRSMGMTMGNTALGNTTMAREDARAVWIWPWLESVMQDLRYAIRNLRRQPGFTLVALATLGIAIGLNTAFFTVFDAVALRWWPVKDPSRLVKILAKPPMRGPHGFSIAEVRYFAIHSKTLSDVVVMGEHPVKLGFEAFGKHSWAIFVSGNYFQALGVPMERGRGFMPEEDVLDSPVNVAVLSYPLWRDHYGSDPAILGKQIRLDDVPFTVVGVAGEQFTGTIGGREDLWAPFPALQSMRLQGNTRAFLRNPQACCSNVAARLANGVTHAQAQAELAVLSRQFDEQYKLDPGSVLIADPSIFAGQPAQKKFTPVFALMFAGLIMVLLLACANVGNLLLARAAARQREIEVRRALGAARARIVRQLLTEGFVLAFGAAALGVALAARLPDLVFSLAEDGPNVKLNPDWRVIVYAAALALLACVAFALAPALHGTRSRIGNRLSLRNVLLGVQIAVSVVLLTGAGLMVSGVRAAHERDPGFRIHDVSVVSFEVPVASYDSNRTLGFFNQLSRELETQADLGPVAITAREPLGNSHWNVPFRLPNEPPTTEHDIQYQQISAAYFDVLGIPFVAGRNFQSSDEGHPAVIVNESMARRYFEGENPIGKSIVFRDVVSPIIGVTRDASLAYVEGPGPLLFTRFRGDQIPKLLLRSSAPGAADRIAAITKRIDTRARAQLTPLSDNLDRQLTGSRIMAGIAGMLGTFALILAAVGISGVFAYVVEQRTKEIGIRMALGAAPGQVIRIILYGTARAAIIGLIVGFVAAAAAAKLLAEYLYGVSPYNPQSYLGVVTILAVAGIAAAYLPARRATKVDPLTALRVE
jgi:predicted permease